MICMQGMKSGMDSEDGMEEKTGESPLTLTGHMQKFGSGLEPVLDTE